MDNNEFTRDKIGRDMTMVDYSYLFSAESVLHSMGISYKKTYKKVASSNNFQKLNE